MDKLVSKIAALGIPGLVLVTAIGATGLAGGAAITTALAALGPGGILGGIATLGIIGLISEGIAQYGVDAIFSAVIKELYRKGETKEEILRKIKKYPISKELKRKLKENIEKASELIREAAAQGAQVILLPELFERPYFCQERRYEYYGYARTLEENDAVIHMKKLAKELETVIPVSFYEAGDHRQMFNSVAVIDADGSVRGIYRKTHIPDDHYYQEKFYFTPGDTGFRAFKTRYGTIGVGICWDQWFPETARGLALKGAELLFYPTAIGSEPILGCDSMPHWRRCMMGHAACNLMPVIAANRIGTETVEPCAENGQQSSALTFYGSSFITDATGEVTEEMDRVSEGFILHTFDLDEIEEERRSWGLFRDRRPEIYLKE